MTGKAVKVLKSIIEGQCQEMSINNLALEIMPDNTLAKVLIISGQEVITAEVQVMFLKSKPKIILIYPQMFCKYSQMLIF